MARPEYLLSSLSDCCNCCALIAFKFQHAIPGVISISVKEAWIKQTHRLILVSELILVLVLFRSEVIIALVSILIALDLQLGPIPCTHGLKVKVMQTLKNTEYRYCGILKYRYRIPNRLLKIPKKYRKTDTHFKYRHRPKTSFDLITRSSSKEACTQFFRVLIDATISCRTKKAVVGVTQLISALISIHSSMTFLADMYLQLPWSTSDDSLLFSIDDRGLFPVDCVIGLIRMVGECWLAIHRVTVT